MLRWRLLLGTLLIATLAVLFWLDAASTLPGIWLAPVLLAFGVLGTGEAIRLARAAGMRPLAGVVYLGSLLILAAPWTGSVKGPMAGASVGDWTSWVVALVLIAIFLGEMVRYQKPGEATANIAAAVFAVVYVGLFLSYAVQLRLRFGVGALASLIVVVKMGDTGAYTVGRLVGRHKLVPRLSPAKTIEGAAGALAFSLLGSWATFTWLAGSAGADSTGAGYAMGWGWIPFGIVVGTAGMLGDLAESLLKRDCGLKDSSSWLPGFGGVLDILDSILLAAPIAYVFWVNGLVGR
jgi:phosphatidate cytidylyltransferase